MIIVTGMHRSGTSAMAGALAKCGFFAGRDLIGPTPCNEKGHYEPNALVRFNDDMLAHNQGSWDDPPEEVTWNGECVAQARRLLKDIYGDDREACVMKDPRISLMVPFWHKVTEGTATWIFMWRDIEEIALSLHKRNGFSLNRGRLLTALYHLEMEKRNTLVAARNVSYPALCTEPARTLAFALDIEKGEVPHAAVDFVEEGLRHHVAMS